MVNTSFLWWRLLIIIVSVSLRMVIKVFVRVLRTVFVLAEIFIMCVSLAALIWVSCDIFIFLNVDGNYTDAYGYLVAAR